MELRWNLVLNQVAYEHLFEIIGTEPVIVMVSPAFVDITTKLDLIRDEKPWTVIWVSKQVKGMIQNREQNRIVCGLDCVVRALKKRKSLSNVIFFTVHAAATFESIYRIREILPGVKIVSYAYDWMHLFVPREKRDMWKVYDPAGKGWPEAEYDAIDGVISGEIVDGVLHKDYGNNFPMLKDCRSPTLWFPPVLPRGLFQKLPEPTVENRIAYIGTIVSEKTHRREHNLFEDIFMEEIFDDVSRQGAQIDAFSLEPPDDAVGRYRERFPTGRVKLYHGKLLGQLLPNLSGRYRWGWMLYYWVNPQIMGHIAVTIPVKVFTYLALGVPILVSEEMQSVARIVNEFKCGLVLSQEQIKNSFADTVSACDYEELQRGVLKAREALNIESYQKPFSDFMTKVMEAKYARSTQAPTAGAVRSRKCKGKNHKYWPAKSAVGARRTAKQRRRR